MKIMIDEKAAKLAEELSEVVAVEDGNVQVGKNLEVDGDLQVNGESNVNSLYKFKKTLNQEDFTDNICEIALPLTSLVKEIRLENICINIIYSVNMFLILNATTRDINLQSPVDPIASLNSVEYYIDGFYIGGNTIENKILLYADDPTLVQNIEIEILYQTNNSIGYEL